MASMADRAQASSGKSLAMNVPVEATFHSPNLRKMNMVNMNLFSVSLMNIAKLAAHSYLIH